MSTFLKYFFLKNEMKYGKYQTLKGRKTVIICTRRKQEKELNKDKSRIQLVDQKKTRTK